MEKQRRLLLKDTTQNVRNVLLDFAKNDKITCDYLTK